MPGWPAKGRTTANSRQPAPFHSPLCDRSSALDQSFRSPEGKPTAVAGCARIFLIGWESDGFIVVAGSTRADNADLTGWCWSISSRTLGVEKRYHCPKYQQHHGGFHGAGYWRYRP